MKPLRLSLLTLLAITLLSLPASAQTDVLQEVRSELGLDDDSVQRDTNLPSQPAFQVMDTTFPIGWIPEKTRRLVNDYAGILTAEQTATLEERLVAFDDSTSNQVMVLIVPDLGGDEIAAFTQNVWNAWGVGNKKYNNGVIVVVKPKNSTKGQVRIQTGYGLEGALPDIFCSKIIKNEMIPHFQDNDYYGGIVAALDVILPVCAGEYDEKRYDDSSDGAAGIFMLLMFIAVVIVVVYFSRHSSDSSGTPPFFGSSLGRSSGSWGNFSSGSFGGSSFGGGGFGGGGFGGFGGGFSGGGGASGSW
ncbi:MAG: TPM domain-containing protein [Bacteroidales bacterium]|nr:TPM domain-containing protein [Bacteroidales bacterium]